MLCWWCFLFTGCLAFPTVRQMGKCFSSCGDSQSSADQNGKNAPTGLPQKPPMTPPAVAGQTTVPPPLPQREHLPGGTHPGSKPGMEYANGAHPAKAPEKHKLHQSARNGMEGSSSAKVSKSEFSESRVNKLFDKYKDGGEDAILAEGMEKFCVDLMVHPAEFIVLVLAWKFQANTMCRFTRTEFVQGCKSIKADCIKAIQSRFPDIRHEVVDETKFKDLYRFTFNFGLDSEGGQRTLPCDIAIPLWKLVFENNEPPLLERWCDFLVANQTRGISRDTWQMFLNFTEVIGDNLDNYDDNEAWPSLFDDFVEYEREKMKQTAEAERALGSGDHIHSSMDGEPTLV